MLNDQHSEFFALINWPQLKAKNRNTGAIHGVGQWPFNIYWHTESKPTEGLRPEDKMLQISNFDKINDFEDFDRVESTRSDFAVFQTWLQIIAETLASFTYLWLLWAGTGGSIGGSRCRGLRW